MASALTSPGQVHIPRGSTGAHLTIATKGAPSVQSPMRQLLVRLTISHLPRTVLTNSVMRIATEHLVVPTEMMSGAWLAKYCYIIVNYSRMPWTAISLDSREPELPSHLLQMCSTSSRDQHASHRTRTTSIPARQSAWSSVSHFVSRYARGA